MKTLLQAVAADLAARDMDAASDVADRLTAVAGRQPGARTRGTTHHRPHLATALAAPGNDPLTALLAPLANDLPWSDGANFPMPACFAGRFAYCEIAGPDGMIAAEGFRFGAYIQFPDTWYPLHSHVAEELYFILSGTAEWTRDGIAARPEPPGTLIRHASWEGHATLTGAEPLLALWAWRGDVAIGNYQVDDA